MQNGDHSMSHVRNYIEMTAFQRNHLQHSQININVDASCDLINVDASCDSPCSRKWEFRAD